MHTPVGRGVQLWCSNGMKIPATAARTYKAAAPLPHSECRLADWHRFSFPFIYIPAAFSAYACTREDSVCAISQQYVQRIQQASMCVCMCRLSATCVCICARCTCDMAFSPATFASAEADAFLFKFFAAASLSLQFEQDTHAQRAVGPDL